ncbi:hypothetical protein KP509_23G028200 [Ceratopteris richardii]|uniref:Uncharacterized protein n=1 Tax=Ceratopteris richardii TaxID=49495 RepID=A0A8T2S0M0_CERRI|nr:hypothetical protein KP509_23G028200 [Ceratopteris richardii]
MVLYGQSFGILDPMPISTIQSKSLFATPPSMFHYTATWEELLATIEEVFENVVSGIVTVHVNKKIFTLTSGSAHIDLEGRKTTRSIVLVVERNDYSVSAS